MSVKRALEEVLTTLPEDRLRDVLNFARFLSFGTDRDEWRRLGLSALARACGLDEPEYTEADVKPGLDR